MADDNEAARESLPSISDLSLNPSTTPTPKPPSTEGKAKKEAAEKGLHYNVNALQYIPFAPVFETDKIVPLFLSHCHSSRNFIETDRQRTDYKQKQMEPGCG